LPSGFGIFKADSHEKPSDAMQAVSIDPSFVGVELGTAKGFGRAELAGDMMQLPLRIDLGEINHALGVVMMSDALVACPPQP